MWTPLSVSVVAAVALPVAWQLAHRLVQAMLDTNIVLGASPTPADHLHAAAGAAGGGLTLAIAVAALGVVKGRVGYLVAALGVFGLFVVLPVSAHTASAGLVAAPMPSVADMIRPPAWETAGRLAAVFWLALTALGLAVADLLVRSADALVRAGRALRNR